jgi:3-oxoacyl-[acyl-carrier protein] reductase
MVAVAESELGSIDVLVNNAALFLERGIEEITDDEINSQVDVNIKGTIHCTKAVVPSMREQGSGRIVSIASTAGKHGSPTDPVYAATKGGVISLSKSIAKQYTSEGILTNAVAPGPTSTKMIREERRPKLCADSPINRLVDPTEVADAIRFFVDATAISGQVLEVDGGRII